MYQALSEAPELLMRLTISQRALLGSSMQQRMQHLPACGCRAEWVSELMPWRRLEETSGSSSVLAMPA